MAIRGRRHLLAFTVILSGFVLGGILLYGQFGDERIRPTAAMLDQKLEDLVTAAVG